MAEATNGKNLETQLKKVALASACTLTGPTGYQVEPSNEDFAESLEERVRRVRQDQSVYKWDEKEDESETTDSNFYVEQRQIIVQERLIYERTPCIDEETTAAFDKNGPLPVFS
ncbi:unnamed protein product [Porites evermanni]|uniref:Uncharacterized protein n=1 Tax=Porites evermanni TaxID=104178 RepID=A0ABN8MBV4_9CNID|nr:unnamed protein product [Porites evermanni]